MALIKTNHQLEQATFIFDDAGEVVDVEIQVNYTVEDDVTGEEETRVRKTVSAWDNLPPGITHATANTLGKRLKELADQV